MPSLYARSGRARFWRNSDGQHVTYKDNDSVESYTIDWSDVLGSDTISSSSWDTSGVTGASESNTTTTTTIKISNTGGYAENTIVTAGGLTHQRTLVFEPINE